MGRTLHVFSLPRGDGRSVYALVSGRDVWFGTPDQIFVRVRADFETKYGKCDRVERHSTRMSRRDVAQAIRHLVGV